MRRASNGNGKYIKSATGGRSNGHAKECKKCRTWFTSEFFADDRSKRCGLQSWCRLCKAKWELGPENAWKRLSAWLRKHEPASLLPPNGWTEELYLSRWKEVGGKCEGCGAGLGEWQVSGHRLDRIDNDTPHIPANCQMLCWVCNRKKSNKSWMAFKIELQPYLDQFGEGRIPWRTIEPWAKRVELPDPDPYRIEVQVALPGLISQIVFRED